MSKKATMGEVAIGVIIIALIVVFIVILAKTKTQALKILEDSECKASISSHTMLLKTTGEAMVTDIYCPTKYYTIPKSTDVEIKHYMAEAMKSCWATWGAGEIRLFEGEGYFCHICSVVDFKETGKTVSGFSDYLVSTPFKEGTSASYFDYLAGFSSEKAPQLMNERVTSSGYIDTIDTTQSYATLFLYIKGESGIKTFIDGFQNLGLGTTGSGITAGLVFGTAGVVILTGGISIIPIAAITAIGGIIGYAASDDVAWMSSIQFIPYNAQSIEELGCKISPVRQEKKDAVT